MMNVRDDIYSILASNMSNEDKKNRINQYHPYDVASVILKSDSETRIQIYEVLGDFATARVISCIDDADFISHEFGKNHLIRLLNHMELDIVVAFLLKLPEDEREDLVKELPAELQKNIYLVQKYHSFCIGSKMTNNYISINKNVCAKEAMSHVIQEGQTKANVSTIYVVDDDNVLVGALELRVLIRMADDEEIIKNVKTNYPYFLATDITDECVERFREYKLSSYPILDPEKKLLGVIFNDDVVQTIDTEMAEDFAKFASLTDVAKKTDSTIDFLKKRLPWLLILMILGLFEAFAMTGYKNTIVALPAAMFFQVLILGTAGNAATQALGASIRLLASNKKDPINLIKTIAKSFWSGLTIGIAVGLVGFILSYIFMYVLRLSFTASAFDTQDALKGSLFIGLSLAISVLSSTLLGTIVPYIVAKLKFDPANISAPFITVLSDAIAIIVFYTLLSQMFSNLL